MLACSRSRITTASLGRLALHPIFQALTAIESKCGYQRVGMDFDSFDCSPGHCKASLDKFVRCRPWLFTNNFDGNFAFWILLYKELTNTSEKPAFRWNLKLNRALMEFIGTPFRMDP